MSIFPSNTRLGRLTRRRLTVGLVRVRSPKAICSCRYSVERDRISNFSLADMSSSPEEMVEEEEEEEDEEMAAEEDEEDEESDGRTEEVDDQEAKGKPCRRSPLVLST